MINSIELKSLLIIWYIVFEVGGIKVFFGNLYEVADSYFAAEVLLLITIMSLVTVLRSK